MSVDDTTNSMYQVKYRYQELNKCSFQKFLVICFSMTNVTGFPELIIV